LPSSGHFLLSRTLKKIWRGMKFSPRQKNSIPRQKIFIPHEKFFGTHVLVEGVNGGLKRAAVGQNVPVARLFGSGIRPPHAAVRLVCPSGGLNRPSVGMTDSAVVRPFSVAAISLRRNLLPVPYRAFFSARKQRSPSTAISRTLTVVSPCL
jgi:hypothetical protein